MRHCTISSKTLNNVQSIRPDFAYEGTIVRSQ